MTTEGETLAALPELEVVPFGTLIADLGERHLLTGAPFGGRMVTDVTGARVQGDRLNARMVGTAAADWSTLAGDGVLQVDVRMTLETHDGALILMQYNGRADFSDLSAPGPVYSTPRFETGDERYAWLNFVQLVAKGAALPPSRLGYRLYELR